MFLVDSHCHIDSLDFNNVHKDAADVVQKAHAAGVSHFLCAGTELDTFEKMYEMIKPFKVVFASCAVHPENVNADNINWSESQMKEYLSYERVIAVGETGLDYVCTPETKALQKKSFERQIGIAKELNKPLIIHARGATIDCVDMIYALDARDVGGVMHCFCDDTDIARKVLDMGYYISFSGIVTFKNAKLVQESCKYVPLDRMLVETDSPYLAPVPKRGKPNEPAYVSHVAQFIAELKNTTYEQVCSKTSMNFEDLFHVKL
jgi:TatD DNase family protein